MNRIVIERDNKAYNDSNILYQIKYFFGAVEQVEFSEGKVVITIPDTLQIDEEIIIDIINGNKVGVEIPSSELTIEKELLTPQEKEVISLEGKRVLEYVKNNFHKSFTDGRIKESPGINLKKGKWLALYKMLDTALVNIINAIFEAYQIEVPNIIDIRELQRSNYLKGSFHHINTISHMDRVYDKINRFRKMDITDTIDKEYLSPPTQALNPAVCLHCYPMFKNKSISENMYVTAIGQTYRDESGNLNNDIRLKEFTMREVVYFGKKENAAYAFDRMLQVMKQFGKSLEIDCKLIPANDIFFDDNIGKKTAFQKALQNKIELEVYDKKIDSYVAIASSNRHGNHFSKPYNIRCEDESAVTMCLAFGYERIMTVIVDAHARIDGTPT